MAGHTNETTSKATAFVRKGLKRKSIQMIPETTVVPPKNDSVCPTVKFVAGSDKYDGAQSDPETPLRMGSPFDRDV